MLINYSGATPVIHDKPAKVINRGPEPLCVTCGCKGMHTTSDHCLDALKLALITEFGDLGKKIIRGQSTG